MDTIIVALFALVAVAAASDRYHNNGYRGDNYGYGYGYGFKRTHNGIQAAYNNAERQKAVNYLAESVGVSSGTAYRYGVPGTGRYFGAPAYYRGGNYGYNDNHGYNNRVY